MLPRTRGSHAIWLVLVLVLGLAAVAWAVLARPRQDPESVWQAGQAALRDHQFDRAEAAVARLAQLRAPSPYDWMLRAQVAMARGRSEEALKDLAQIPEDHRLKPQARLLDGQLELRRHRVRRAELALLDAVRIAPDLIQAHRELIYIYGVQLRRRELHEQFRALSELTPLTFDNVFHWCLTRNSIWEPLEISRMMTRFLRADPDDRWSRLALAEAQRDLGRPAEAEKTLAALPESDADARAIRVRVALDRGDLARAEALAAGGPEDHPELARLRGRMALAKGDGPAAVRAFRIAYKADPDNRETLFGLTGALTATGDTAAAEFREKSRRYDVLGSLMERASVEANRDDPALMRALGAACEAVGRLPEARAWYRLAIGRDALDKEAQEAVSRLDAAIAAQPASHAGP